MNKKNKFVITGILGIIFMMNGLSLFGGFFLGISVYYFMTLKN